MFKPKVIIILEFERLPNPEMSSPPQTSKNTSTVIKNRLVTKSNGKNQTNNQPSFSMQYDIVEDLKKMRANISIMELCKIAYQRKLLEDALNKMKTNKIS